MGSSSYSPQLQRFIQQDSYSGDVDVPLSLNRYAYVRDSPVTYMDPTGHSWWDNWSDFVEAVKDFVALVISSTANTDSESPHFAINWSGQFGAVIVTECVLDLTVVVGIAAAAAWTGSFSSAGVLLPVAVPSTIATFGLTAAFMAMASYDYEDGAHATPENALKAGGIEGAAQVAEAVVMRLMETYG